MTGTVVISRLAPPIIMNLNCLVTTTHYSARPCIGWLVIDESDCKSVQCTEYSLQSTVYITSVEVDEIDIRCSISGGNRYQL